MANQGSIPDVSIVVPVRNSAATVQRALDSVLAQDGVQVQLIVIDGASEDGTSQILRAASDQIDALLIEPDRGQADALNKGFARATGRYYGWLCADDRLKQGAIANLAGLLDAQPDAVLATGGCERVFDDGRSEFTRPRPDFECRLGYVNGIEQPSTLWRAEAHHGAGQLDEGLHYAFDWDWWCRLQKQGPFLAVDDILSEYVFSGANKTSTGGDAIAEDMYQVIRRYGPHGGRLAEVYRFLYRRFDKAGFYDAGADLPEWRRRVFHLVLHTLHARFGRELIDSYNWNFASRQARGLGW